MIEIPEWAVYGYLCLFVVLCWFLAMQHYKLRAWKLVFTRLSNAERLLLMWPHLPDGRFASRLEHTMDETYERLALGSQPLAKLPRVAAAQGRAALQDLLK